jgi:hypothetical protein
MQTTYGTAIDPIQYYRPRASYYDDTPTYSKDYFIRSLRYFELS